MINWIHNFYLLSNFLYTFIDLKINNYILHCMVWNSTFCLRYIQSKLDEYVR